MEYTINFSNNKINGLVLETDDIVPIEESDLGSHNIINLKKSLKTIYNCIPEKQNIDDRIKYVTKFNKFWSEYDKFIMNISKNLKQKKHNPTIEDIQNAANAKTPIEKQYLSIILKEFEYNYSRKEDISSSRIPTFLDSLSSIQNDSIIFDNNKSKDQYIKNKIEQEKYKKYIPNLNLDNNQYILNQTDYLKTKNGTHLPRKWQEILLRDFKYDNNDQYSWINKVAPFKYHKQLNEYQNKKQWSKIANMLDIGIIIFDIDSAKKILPKSDKHNFFLLFYKHSDKYYPIFINRYNDNNAFNIHLNELSTEILDLLNMSNTYSIEGISSTIIHEPPTTPEPNPTPEPSPAPAAPAITKTVPEKFCKLSKKSKTKKHCVTTKNESENDIINCNYNNKTKRCNTKTEPTPKKDENTNITYCKLSDKIKNKTKKHCVSTKNKDENNPDSCHYNQKTNRCNTRKHK